MNARRSLRPLATLLAIVFLAPALTAGEGERVVFESNFEFDRLPPEQRQVDPGEIELDVLGWHQTIDGDRLPRLMTGELVEGGLPGGRYALRLPAGGGAAVLHSVRGFRPEDVGVKGVSPDHLPVAPGERLTIEAAFRQDDLADGRWELVIIFADRIDSPTGRPDFAAGEAVTLFTGGGNAAPWSRLRGSLIVPPGTIGWRLEWRVRAGRARRPGGLELDDLRVVAAPRLVVTWTDPLHHVRADETVAPVQVNSVGLPAGDYQVDLAVTDEAGDVYLHAERLARYVDERHPIRLLVAAASLTAGPDVGIRRLLVRVRASDGDTELGRDIAFSSGIPPFSVGESVARHGVELRTPLPVWAGSFAPAPVLLRVEEPIPEGWPAELAAIPESQRSGSLRFEGRDVPDLAAAYARAWSEVPRWFVEDAAADPAQFEALTRSASDLLLGVEGRARAIDAGVPRLYSRSALATTDPSPGFVLSVSGAELGIDPESWTVALFRYDDLGASRVHLTDPLGSLYREGRSPEEGFEPRRTLLAWRFVRGFLGSAARLGSEPWLPGARTVLYRRGGRGSVVWIATGETLPSRPVELHVDGEVRAFDALGRPVELPPVEDGTVRIEPRGRFLLVEGIDLELERTLRSLAIEPIESGFRLSVRNHLPDRVILEPELELPDGFIRRGELERLDVAPGGRAAWDLAVEVPSTAGIDGTEWTRGTLTLRSANGGTLRAPFERVLPLESSRLAISLVDVENGVARIRTENRENAPLMFHLYLQATPDGRGERTESDVRLSPGEVRTFTLPLVGPSAPGSELWVGVTFLDGDRGFFNTTFPLDE